MLWQLVRPFPRHCRVTRGRLAGYTFTNPEVPMSRNWILLFRNAATAGAVGIALLAMSGCASRDDVNGPEPDPRAAAIPDDPPHISGTITVVQPGDSVVRTDDTRNPDGR